MPATTQTPLSITQVAERWGISRPTVWRLIDSGQLPARRIGKQWRIEAADAEALGK